MAKSEMPSQELQRLLLFVKQVRLALKPDAEKELVESCLDSCDDAAFEIRKIIKWTMHRYGKSNKRRQNP